MLKIIVFNMFRYMIKFYFFNKILKEIKEGNMEEIDVIKNINKIVIDGIIDFERVFKINI